MEISICTASVLSTPFFILKFFFSKLSLLFFLHTPSSVSSLEPSPFPLSPLQHRLLPSLLSFHLLSGTTPFSLPPSSRLLFGTAPFPLPNMPRLPSPFLPVFSSFPNTPHSSASVLPSPLAPSSPHFQTPTPFQHRSAKQDRTEALRSVLFGRMESTGVPLAPFDQTGPNGGPNKGPLFGPIWPNGEPLFGSPFGLAYQAEQNGLCLAKQDRTEALCSVLFDRTVPKGSQCRGRGRWLMLESREKMGREPRCWKGRRWVGGRGAGRGGDAVLGGERR